MNTRPPADQRPNLHPRWMLRNLGRRLQLLAGPSARWGILARMAMIIVILMSFAYETSFNTQSASAQTSGNYNPPPLLSGSTLRTDKYYATPDQFDALRRMEQQAIDDIIEDHNLSPSDVNAVRSWARADATAELWALIVRAIETPTENRTADQQHVVQWITDVQKRQTVAAAVEAAREYAKWSALDLNMFQNLINTNADRAALAAFLGQNVGKHHGGDCAYRSPAPYQDEYTGYAVQSCFIPCPLCYPSPPSHEQFARWGAAVSNPEVLSADYVRLTRDIVQSIVLGTSIVGATVLGVSLAKSTTLAVALANTVFQQVVLPYAARPIVTSTLAAAAAAAKSAGSTSGAAAGASAAQAATMGAPAAAASVAGLISVAIVMITIAVLVIINLVEIFALPGKFADGIVNARGAIPDVNAMLDDPQQVGGLFSLFIAAALPLPRDESCDNTVLGFGINPCLNAPAVPAPQTSDPIFEVQRRGSSDTFQASSITHQDRSIQSIITTRMAGNWFVHSIDAQLIDPDLPDGTPPVQSQSLRIRYVDWDEKAHVAWLFKDPDQGYMFLSSPEKDPNGQPMNPAQCVADGTCDYHKSINYIGDDGWNYTASVVTATAPVIDGIWIFDDQGERVTETPALGQLVYLTTYMKNPPGRPVTYEWRLKDPSSTVIVCPPAPEACEGFGPPIEGFQIPYTFNSAGEWRVRLTLTDTLGLKSRYDITLNIAPLGAPTLTLNPASGAENCHPILSFCDVRTGPLNTQMRLSGSFTHLGPNDRVDINVNWGDGTASSRATIIGGAVSVLLGWNGELTRYDIGNYLFNVSHRYTVPGTYTVTATVTDPGGTTTQTATYRIGTLPTIEWTQPAPITYGTPLGSSQLNATATEPSSNTTVPGSFSYFINNQQVVEGDILPVGAHSIEARFTPDDGEAYLAPTGLTRTLQIDLAQLTVQPPTVTMIHGDQTLPNISDVTFTGSVNNEGPADLTGTLSCSLLDGSNTTVELTSSLPVGEYVIDCDGLTSTNYSIAFNSGVLTVTDGTKPEITYTIDGGTPTNDWYTSDVTVTWTVIDPETAVTSEIGCDPTTISADTVGDELTCTATSAGGTDSKTVTIKRDTVKPVVAYTGNRPAYRLLDDVAIVCSATDATSGVATTDCQDVQAAAWTLQSGVNSRSATATDTAGHEASALVQFTVGATHSDLCTLTRQVVSNAALALSACASLTAARIAEAARMNVIESALLSAYRTTIDIAVRQGRVSREYGTILQDWSRTL